MAKRGILLAFILFIVIIVISSAFILAAETSTSATTENDCLYYFYGDGCKGCTETSEQVRLLQSKYPLLQVKKMEVYYHPENQQLVEDFFEAYNVPKSAQGIPIVFIPGSYIVGENGIVTLLEERILDNTDSICPVMAAEGTIGVVGEKSSKSILDSLTFGVVTSSAFSSFLSIGALALFLILLFILIVNPEKKEAMEKGFTFLVGALVAYILFGIGWFSWLGYSSASYYFTKAVSILAILFALIMMKGFFAGESQKHKDAAMSSTEKLRRLINSTLSYPLLLLGGLVFGLLSFMGIHKNLLYLRYLITDGLYRSAAVPLMFYYLLIFLLPMIITILIVFLLGTKLEENALKKGLPVVRHAAWWKGYHYEVFNFILSIILLVLAIIVLLM